MSNMSNRRKTKAETIADVGFFSVRGSSGAKKG